MRLAKAVGLNVPNVSLLTINEVDHLLIERYDRVNTPDGWERLHQEDFCQALGVNPYDKYESQGGPSLRVCADLIREHSAMPSRDLIQFIC
jgi:serine/threonine-protein kinase HipA